MRNLAHSTAKAESAAEGGLKKKRAREKAQEVWGRLKAEHGPEDFERLRVALIPLVLNRPSPKGVKWTPKDQAKAEGEKLFKVGESA